MTTEKTMSAGGLLDAIDLLNDLAGQELPGSDIADGGQKARAAIQSLIARNAELEFQSKLLREENAKLYVNLQSAKGTLLYAYGNTCGPLHAEISKTIDGIWPNGYLAAG